MEGTKIFKAVYYMTECTCEYQKAKKIGTEISILGAFVALSKLFFTILSCELSFALSRIPSRPVSVFRTESRFVPSRQKPVLTQHYLRMHQCSISMVFSLFLAVVYMLLCYNGIATAGLQLVGYPNISALNSNTKHKHLHT